MRISKTIFCLVIFPTTNLVYASSTIGSTSTTTALKQQISSLSPTATHSFSISTSAPHATHAPSTPNTTTQASIITQSSPTQLHFSPTLPATLSSLTTWTYGPSLASALAGAQSSWASNPTYVDLAVLVFNTAPAPAQTSLLVSGYNWADIVRQTWFPGALPTPYAQFVDAVITDMQGLVNQAVQAGEVRVNGGARMLAPGGELQVLVALGTGLAVLLLLVL